MFFLTIGVCYLHRCDDFSHHCADVYDICRWRSFLSLCWCVWRVPVTIFLITVLIPMTCAGDDLSYHCADIYDVYIWWSFSSFFLMCMTCTGGDLSYHCADVYHVYRWRSFLSLCWCVWRVQVTILLIIMLMCMTCTGDDLSHHCADVYHVFRCDDLTMALMPVVCSGCNGLRYNCANVYGMCRYGDFRNHRHAVVFTTVLSVVCEVCL